MTIVSHDNSNIEGDDPMWTKKKRQRQRQKKTNTKTNTERDDFPPGQGGDPSDLIEPVEKEEEATRSSLHIDSVPQDFHL